MVPAEVAVGAYAAHLGRLEVCPVAEVEGAGPWLGRVVDAYRAQRRLGLAPSPCPPRLVQALLVLDEEAARLAEAERARAEAAKPAPAAPRRPL